MKEKRNAFCTAHKDTALLLLQVLLLSAGVYAAYPGRGGIATFPLGIAFFIGGSLLREKTVFSCLLSSALAFFYASAMGLSDPVLFAGYVLCQVLFACFAVRGLRLVRRGGKVRGSLLFFSVLILSLLLTFFYCGTPTSFGAARDRARAYLADCYPDQRFSDLELYYDCRKKGYEATVSYEFEGNLLESTLFFGKETRDGFREDLTFWMQEKRKSALIDILRDQNVRIDSEGIAGEGDPVLHGAYGAVDALPEEDFLFSATFREEKPTGREFAEAVAESLSILKEKDFAYGAITFYALDAGNAVFRCTVSPDVAPEPDAVLSLVTAAEK